MSNIEAKNIAKFAETGENREEALAEVRSIISGPIVNDYLTAGHSGKSGGNPITALVAEADTENKSSPFCTGIIVSIATRL